MDKEQKETNTPLASANDVSCVDLSVRPSYTETEIGISTGVQVQLAVGPLGSDNRVYTLPFTPLEWGQFLQGGMKLLEELWYPLRLRESSNIQQATYCRSERKLRVQFVSGSIYEYANVPSEVADAWSEADSVGKYFAANIRKNTAAYPYQKVDRLYDPPIDDEEKEETSDES